MVSPSTADSMMSLGDFTGFHLAPKELDFPAVSTHQILLGTPVLMTEYALGTPTVSIQRIA